MSTKVGSFPDPAAMLPLGARGREIHPFSRRSVAQFPSKVSFPLENFHDGQLENMDDMSTQDGVVRPQVGLLQRDWPDGVREPVCVDKDADSEWHLWSTATASENSWSDIKQFNKAELQTHTRQRW